MSILSGSSSEKISLYFLLSEDGKTEVKDETKMAFQECYEAKLEPQWITHEDALKLRAKRDVIVIEEFSGNVFNYLRKQKCVICGPKCLRICLAENSPIPEINSPIFITALRGLVVTATNIDASTKIEIKEKVNFMGGTYTSNLVESVTHIVCGGVRSVKYDKASELGIFLMTIDWVREVWNEGLKRNVHGTDPEFQMYNCPVFLNLEITTSNINSQEKNKLKELINANGGTYSGELKQNSTNILIVSDNPNSSKKYIHARSWNLPCLKSSWIYESVKKGFAVNLTNHFVTAELRCSTPTENKEEMPSFSGSDISMVSTIPCVSLSSKSHIDETILTNVTVPYSSVPSKNKKKVEVCHKKIIETLNVSHAKSAGPFLDGCKVYLSGFSMQELDKLRRILNLGGAIIFSELSDAVTHVIAGNFVSADAAAVNKGVNRPHLVSVEWLAASLKQQSPALECLFSRIEPSNSKVSTAEPPSPLSQKGMQLLMNKNETFKSPAAVNGNLSGGMKHKESTPSTSKSGSDNNPPKINRNLFKDFINVEDLTKADDCNNQNKANNVEKVKQADDGNTLNGTDASSLECTDIFKELVFMILGFDSDMQVQIEEMIISNGGTVVQQSYSGVTDYTIVPVHGVSITGLQSEVVTPHWLEDCNENKSLVSVQYYHQPVSVAGNRTPLDDCVVTLSVYSSRERLFLAEVVTILGALSQEIFARKVNLSKGVKANTHLVVPTTGSSKYNAAIKWNIPVVNKDWLLECAKHGSKMPESQFSVAENDVSNPVSVTKKLEGNVRYNETTSVMEQETSVPINRKAQNIPVHHSTPKINPVLEVDIASKQTPNNLRTLKNSENIPVFNITPSTITPLPTVNDNKNIHNGSINHLLPKVRRVSEKNTPVSLKRLQSIATPETPYEELFPDTGNTTRKRIKRWMDRFEAEQDPIDIPAVVQRRDSTPLSELMKKAFAKFGKTPDGSLIETNDQTRNNGESSTRNEAGNISGINNVSSNLPLDDNKSSHNMSLAEKLDKLSKKLATPTSTQTTTTTAQQRTIANNISRERLEMQSNSSSGSSTKCADVNFDSQKNDVGWDEPVESVEKAKILGKNKKFVLSNIQESKRDYYTSIINNLGAVLLKSDHYSDETTHLVTECPVRSQKLLCSIAAGKWVLHVSYLEESYKANTLLPEEDFEWGNPKSKENIPPLETERETFLAKAAFRWRNHLQNLGHKTGAYDGMKAVLFCSEKKLADNLVCLIKAGNGTVLEQKSFLEATHCFVELRAIEHIECKFKLIASKNIYCLEPVYLCELLTGDPSPNPERELIEPYRKYFNKK